MTSDNERREVAQKLRDIKRVDLGNGLVCLSCDLGEVLGFDWADDYHIFEFSVDLLADLIDRPTCKKEEHDEYYWRCTRCGGFICWDAVTDCCGVIPTRYCPNCGAEVVNDD